jgi:hypothetical protein
VQAEKADQSCSSDYGATPAARFIQPGESRPRTTMLRDPQQPKDASFNEEVHVCSFYIDQMLQFKHGEI